LLQRVAVNVQLQLAVRQPIKFVPRPAFFLFHQPKDTKVPRRRIESGHGAVVQHRELLRQSLARRQAPGTLDLRFLIFTIAE
jgi:hypothetical protein